MTVYLDTSALLKMYHNEPLTPAVDQYLASLQPLSAVIISQLALVEFNSAAWQKQRIAAAQNLQGFAASTILFHIETDIRLSRYLAADVKQSDYEIARAILNRCNSNGLKLRALDAMQLAVPFRMGTSIDMVVSCDKDLSAAARFLEMPVKHIGPGEMQDSVNADDPPIPKS